MLNEINAEIEKVLRLHPGRAPGSNNSLHRDHWEHRLPRVGAQKKKHSLGFTSRYNLTRLVYYDFFYYPDAAIAREKEIKGRRREKKLALVESMNPRWADLAEKWQDLYKPDPAVDCNEIPRPAGQNAGLRDDAVVDGDNR
jgi:predicted GIY-YIG superfamily endonuclease